MSNLSFLIRGAYLESLKVVSGLVNDGEDRFNVIFLTSFFLKCFSDRINCRRALLLRECGGDVREMNQLMKNDPIFLPREASFDVVYDQTGAVLLDLARKQVSSRRSRRGDREMNRMSLLEMGQENAPSEAIAAMLGVEDISRRFDPSSMMGARATLKPYLAFIQALELLTQANPVLSGCFQALELTAADYCGGGDDIVVSAIWNEIHAINTVIDCDRDDFFIDRECGLIFENIYMMADQNCNDLTPSSLCGFMCSLAKISGSDRIYDPACGIGNFLIRAAESQGISMLNDKGACTVYGQELDPRKRAVCILNLLIHNIWHFKIWLGDTLAVPKNLTFDNNIEGLDQFDFIASQLPINPIKRNIRENNMGKDRGKGAKLRLADDKYNRFSLSEEAACFGEFAFIQHILASLNSVSGSAVVMMSSALLHDNWADAGIRKKMIDLNLVDAVFDLPCGVNYKTAIACSILVLKKNRKCNAIYLQEIEPVPGVKWGNDDNVKWMHALKDAALQYDIRRNSTKSADVSVQTIQQNNYSLRVSDYLIKKIEDPKTADVQQIIKKLNKELSGVQKEIDDLMKNIGII